MEGYSRVASLQILYIMCRPLTLCAKLVQYKIGHRDDDNNKDSAWKKIRIQGLIPGESRVVLDPPGSSVAVSNQ